MVGFTLGYYKKDPDGGHAIDRDKTSTLRQARSLDGGETWTIEVPSYLNEEEEEADPSELEESIDFSNPNLAIKFRSNLFYYSTDRCKNWNGPFQLPDFGREKLLCRTDYLIEGKDRLTAFIAASKEGTDDEGQPLCIRTTDGGKTWENVGWICESPPKDYGYAIMPSTVKLKSGAYLSMIRRGGKFDGVKKWWIEPYLSPNEGESWYRLEEPTIDNGGNPASMIRLADGRIALTYGWRHAPYGIRARISEDEGQSWSDEVILRCDGANWDLGYPRTVQREDGKCVTVYYYHHPDQPERFIGATIWEPSLPED
ncbi:MAG: exo-alpha-sialidase [Candidatus Omnitrophica bacterium]|nr:exo-alpha-sialidase [Candidatus Omnitrophota bacterium]